MGLLSSLTNGLDRISNFLDDPLADPTTRISRARDDTRGGLPNSFPTDLTDTDIYMKFAIKKYVRPDITTDLQTDTIEILHCD